MLPPGGATHMTVSFNTPLSARGPKIRALVVEQTREFIDVERIVARQHGAQLLRG